MSLWSTVVVRIYPREPLHSQTPGEPLAFIPGCQPYTRWITGNASSIVVIGNTSNSIHGAYFMVSS